MRLAGAEEKKRKKRAKEGREKACGKKEKKDEREGREKCTTPS